jgi:AcrR family transcriptional regulator
MNEGDRPRRVDAERNKERVLSSAEAVLARDGLSASMRAIAAEAGVGLGTIYRNFPTQEALYQAIIIRRMKALIEEAASLSAAQDPGQAFFGYFSAVVEHAMRTKAIADLLATAGIDPKSGMADVSRDMRQAVEALLARAQRAGAVRPDLRMPELMALLAAACLAAEHNQWDTRLRTSTLAIVFDGMRPHHGSPEPGGTAAPRSMPPSLCAFVMCLRYVPHQHQKHHRPLDAPELALVAAPG